MKQTAWFWILTGCPYVFGPPNLSQVDASGTPSVDDGADADTDADADADADTDTDTDTDPLPPGDPPFMVFFEVVPRMSEVLVRFELSDADSDLVGSSLTLSDGTNEYVIGIPGEVDTWDPTGISTIALPIPPVGETDTWLDCDTPVQQTWSAFGTDFDGNVGPSVDTRLEIAALGVLSEIGADEFPIDHHVTGEAPPFTGCVIFEAEAGAPGTDLEQLQDDFEAVLFTSATAETYVAQLRWPDTNPADMDIYVYWYPILDEDEDDIADVITLSTGVGGAFEQVTWSSVEPLPQSWLVDFVFYEPLAGAEPPFRAQFLIAPE